MNRQYNILPSVLFLLSLLLCGTSLLAEEKIVDLFDGKTLDGWVTADGKPVTRGWVVEGGLLMRKKRGGNIYTASEYDNFELTFEWKIAKRGNSGVKYRVAHYEKGVWGKPEWLGCEYQMFDDAGRTISKIGSTGSIYNLVAPNDKKKLRPVGKFNTSRIVADGTKIEHWLNGEKIAALNHDGGLAIRRIPIRLKAGENRLVIKTNNTDRPLNKRMWAIHAALEAAAASVTGNC